MIGGAGHALHVREWGRPDGPPLLLIHGWSGNHMCWSHQSPANSRRVPPGRPGPARSRHVRPPPDAEQYTDPDLWAADIAAVIDQCQLRPTVLVAWSYGGFVICDYIRAYGQDAIGAINFVGAA